MNQKLRFANNKLYTIEYTKKKKKENGRRKIILVRLAL